jgi:hypothetical protein
VRAAVGSHSNFNSSQSFVPELTATPFARYPGYAGPLDVQGTVAVRGWSSVGDKMTVTWVLGGLDPACTAGAAPGVANACGIHIHEGTTCADASQVGGHYHSNEPDPWQPVRYVVAPYQTSSGGEWTLEIGYPFSTATGRALVVHDVTGARIACRLLASTSAQYNIQCSAGQSVQCPGSDASHQCMGNQCCPRVPWTGQKTFPCPSATDVQASGCETDYKVETCTRPSGYR